MATSFLIYFLVGVLSGAYLHFVDAYNNVRMDARPIENICVLLWGGVIAPITFCLVLYAIYVETGRDHD